MPERQQQLAHLESLGDATQFAPQMHALIPKCPLLENFSQPEVLLLAHFMEVYRAAPGAEIIREGAGGALRVVLSEARTEGHEGARGNPRQLLAGVGRGRPLGEMSMIDGEPRF